MGAREVFDDAIPCLEHSDLRVRRAALRALWRLGGQRAEPHLLEYLQRSDPDTQVEILFGLGQIRASTAVPAIGALASHAPEKLRIKALETLGEIGNPAAIPTLAEYLKRQGRFFKTVESAEVRLTAGKALSAIGTPEAVAALTRAVEEAPRSGDQAALRKVLERQSWG
jgi:HEAT repeat protein